MPVRHRTRLVAVGSLAALAALPGCGHRFTEAELVKAAIHRTHKVINSIDYTDARGDGETSVRIAQADDFRIKARVSYDGQPGFDEVAFDDALAVRFVQPERVGKILTANGGQETTEISGIPVIDALRSRRWVLDATQAPFIATGSGRTAQIGKDPVADALQALDYVEAAVGEAEGLQRYSPDSISPAYPKSEDDLPKPAAGETRYDLRRPKLPTAAAATSGAQGELSFPTTKHFRKMAVYLKDGLVTHVVEHVDLGGKYLTDTIRYERNLLRDTKAPREVRQQFEQVLTEGDASRVGPRVLEFVNIGLRTVGQDPILVRNMSLDVGKSATAPTVALPTLDTVKADLSGLIISKAAKAAELAAQQSNQQQQGSGSSSDESTTTTTVGGETTTSAPSG
jgi:hypothetical protein